MSLKEKIISLAKQATKEQEQIPCKMENMQKLATNNGKLMVLAELLQFMQNNNL